MTAWFVPFDTHVYLVDDVCTCTLDLDKGRNAAPRRCTNTIYPYSFSVCLFSAATFPPIYQHLPSAVLYLRVVI